MSILSPLHVFLWKGNTLDIFSPDDSSGFSSPTADPALGRIGNGRRVPIRHCQSPPRGFGKLAEQEPVPSLASTSSGGRSLTRCSNSSWACFNASQPACTGSVYGEDRKGRQHLSLVVEDCGACVLKIPPGSLILERIVYRWRATSATSLLLSAATLRGKKVYTL